MKTKFILEKTSAIEDAVSKFLQNIPPEKIISISHSTYCWMNGQLSEKTSVLIVYKE